MATPRGALHRDLEQRFRDLESEVRQLAGRVLSQRKIGHTSVQLNWVRA